MAPATQRLRPTVPGAQRAQQAVSTPAQAYDLGGKPRQRPGLCPKLLKWAPYFERREASREPGCLDLGPPPLPRARRSPAPRPGAGNQAHMARPALFVLAARRRYLRRFLSPRNQQNPKRSLGKMKGAEGPGRGRPRGCGGRELAPDRRRPAGEKARPWGVPRSRPSGVAPSPGVHFGPPPLAAASLGVPRPFSASLPPRPPARGRVLGTPILLQSVFEAPRPARGQEISHLDGGGVGRGPAARARPNRLLGHTDPSPLQRCGPLPSPPGVPADWGAARSRAQAGGAAGEPLFLAGEP